MLQEPASSESRAPAALTAAGKHTPTARPAARSDETHLQAAPEGAGAGAHLVCVLQDAVVQHEGLAPLLHQHVGLRDEEAPAEGTALLAFRLTVNFLKGEGGGGKGTGTSAGCCIYLYIHGSWFLYVP